MTLNAAHTGEDGKTCPRCKKLNLPAALFCKHCGTMLLTMCKGNCKQCAAKCKNK